MFTPIQAHMDSSDWFQGALNDDMSPLMDYSSSSLSGDMLTCSRPLMERRLRPQHDQPLKCPRCDSAHTKFCYYNNYSLSQPRYFCKTCRRYWTKGGNLRNIPVGGGCRKNKKAASSSASSSNNAKSKSPAMTGTGLQINQHGMTPSLTDLHLSFSPEIQLSHLNAAMVKSAGTVSAIQGAFGDPAGSFCFMESKFNPVTAMGNATAGAIDFMAGGDHLSNPTDIPIRQLALAGDVMAASHPSFHGTCSPFGIMSGEGHSNIGGSSLLMERGQKLMYPNNQAQGHNDSDDKDDHPHHHQDQVTTLDGKPNHRILSMEWQQDQNYCSDAGKNVGIRYHNGFGSTWSNGNMNDYNPLAATNQLA
ncbi:hypothetical protein MLD38_012556 [Melastoma candidum]|uniref:Uncharacterized protein n=1 Tax=Melastoma candidum TaxID=119954 RepID=A0ACB9R6Q5_9MYRT|nr:hypothetical protein MLD38_012556 [Melastoma candidum]